MKLKEGKKGNGGEESRVRGMMREERREGEGDEKRERESRLGFQKVEYKLYTCACVYSCAVV